ncbi:MAG TPA: ATP-binding protein [Azospirillaceae bacterium]|nr:ATP-binding protein [Azospirillaceae bacterium]
MRRLILTFLSLLLLAWTVPAAATPIPAAPEAQPIGGMLELLTDPDGSIPAAQILSGERDGSFRPSPGPAPSFSRNTAVHWGRFTIRNEADHAVERLLVLPQPYYRDIRLYQSDGAGGWRERSLVMGDAERQVDDSYRTPVFRLLLPPGDSRFYLRIDYHFVSFALTLRSADAHGDVKATEGTFYGVVFGAMVILSLYPLALGMFVREGPAIPLFVFCALDSLTMFVNIGYPWLVLPPAVASYAWFVVVPYSVIAVLDFSRSYLQLKEKAPLANKVIIGFEIAAFISALIIYAANHMTGVAQLVGISAYIYCAGVAAFLVFRQREALLYLVGFLLLTGFGIVYGLTMAGLFPMTQGMLYTVAFGRTLGVVVLTFGVAYVIGQKREERMAALARSEAALREAKEGLEDRVRERTTELARTLRTLRESQDALVQSEKMAALGQLVAGVAHEINTPVGVVVTASSHLLEQTRTVQGSLTGGTLRRSELTEYFEQAVPACEAVLANASRAASLVQSFKNVAADQSADERRRFPLGDVVSEVVLSLSPHLRACGHRIQVLGAAGLPVELDSHPGALTQVLTNLVMNATQHAYADGQTGGTITVELVPSPEGGAEVEIRVSDDGRGVPEAIRPKIFDPFFTTRRGRGGTGLGLHIVHNLMTKTLGGSIRLDPSAPAGTRFVLRLPLSLGETREAAEAAV